MAENNTLKKRCKRGSRKSSTKKTCRDKHNKCKSGSRYSKSSKKCKKSRRTTSKKSKKAFSKKRKSSSPKKSRKRCKKGSRKSSTKKTCRDKHKKCKTGSRYSKSSKKCKKTSPKKSRKRCKKGSRKSSTKKTCRDKHKKCKRGSRYSKSSKKCEKTSSKGKSKKKFTEVKPEESQKYEETFVESVLRTFGLIEPEKPKHIEDLHDEVQDQPIVVDGNLFFPEGVDEECSDPLYGVHCKETPSWCVPMWINEKNDDKQYPVDTFCEYTNADIQARMNSTDNLKDIYKEQRGHVVGHRESNSHKRKLKQNAEDKKKVKIPKKKGKKGKKPCPPGQRRSSRTGRCKGSKSKK